jgi:hypothetical protein
MLRRIKMNIANVKLTLTKDKVYMAAFPLIDQHKNGAFNNCSILITHVGAYPSHLQ